ADIFQVQLHGFLKHGLGVLLAVALRSHVVLQAHCHPLVAAGVLEDDGVYLLLRHVYQPRRASVSSGLSPFASSPFIGSPRPRETSARTAGAVEVVTAPTAARAPRGRASG